MNEIAEKLGITRQAVHKRAKKEKWPGEVVNKRGDKVFDLSLLPKKAEDVAIAFAETPVALPSPPQPQNGRILSLYSRCDSLPVGSPDLADWQNRVALARADFLRAYVQEKTRAKDRGKSKVAAADDFILAYNTGQLMPTVFGILGPMARSTAEALVKTWRDSGYDYTAVAPRWGNRKGQRKFTSEEFNQLLSFALHPNRLRITEAVRLTKMALDRRAIPSPSSADTLRRALIDWRSQHYDQWVFAREGAKALNDKCLPYLSRDAGLLDVGQVLIADGHKLNFQILHPFTGKPVRMNMLLWLDWASRMPAGFEIMPTETTQAVASSLRKAILRMGKMPQVAYLDNGKAFKAKIFTDQTIDFEEAGFYGMFARLGIETLFAWPYNAQSKPVERFFETFGEVERLMPTYTGTSIQDKPAYMLRNEVLHRAVHEKKYGGWVPTIQEAQVILDGWIAEYGARPHEGLKGLCPQDVFDAGKGPGVDPEALRHLMMAMELKSPGRNGISFLGRDYYDPELYGKKERVLIRYDLSDLSHVLVFDESGAKFLCRAEAREAVHPIARIAGTPDDMAAVKEGIRQKRSLKKATEAAARAYVADAPVLVAIPGPGGSGNGEAGNRRIGEREKGLKVLEMPKAEAEGIEERAAKLRLVELKQKEEPIWRNDADRYEAYLRQECATDDLTTDQMAFMRFFEKTPMYATFKNQFDFLREMLLVPEEEGAVSP